MLVYYLASNHQKLIVQWTYDKKGIQDCRYSGFLFICKKFKFVKFQ